MARYARRSYFDETGLKWWPPSPNLRTVDAAVLYPAVGLLEATNVSVGRGTETPFEVIGAPWMDGHALAVELEDAGIQGISFEPTKFTPTANPHKSTLCRGIRLKVEDRATFDPVRTGIAIALAIRKLYPREWTAGRMRGLLGDPAVAAAILVRRRLPEVEALWQRDLDAFRSKRLNYLLYPP